MRRTFLDMDMCVPLFVHRDAMADTGRFRPGQGRLRRRAWEGYWCRGPWGNKGFEDLLRLDRRAELPGQLR
ncbi:hypothetical protein GCM10010449_09190 [Streptomyces rectiviolaceus]|uniref:Uncharacterized protein n=1 Tax=Streptomyces rectiviolaceus TaxID=332591 RepID=A0ABP6M9U9_9ACTN